MLQPAAGGDCVLRFQELCDMVLGSLDEALVDWAPKGAGLGSQSPEAALYRSALIGELNCQFLLGWNP